MTPPPDQNDVIKILFEGLANWEKHNDGAYTRDRLTALADRLTSYFAVHYMRAHGAGGVLPGLPGGAAL
jgi:hypothetical protein